MSEIARIISFKVEQGSSGLLMVKSDDLPTILLSGRNLEELKRQLKIVVKEHYMRRHSMNVDVVEAVSEASKSRPCLINSLVAIPRSHAPIAAE